jgi:FKBP-type peptidyl-prolyl cis-trans isomerase 2
MKTKKLTSIAICFCVAAVLITGCKKMETIKQGSKVTFHYTLTVDGQVADSSLEKEPFVYEQGKGQIIRGLEEQMLGLKKGDKRTFVIPPEKGYGIRDDKAVVEIPKTQVKDADKLKKNSMIAFMQGGRRYTAIVRNITDDKIILDYNHPMAGKTLNFDITVVEIDNTIDNIAEKE